jgi:small subunit ribosomal protein S12
MATTSQPVRMGKKHRRSSRSARSASGMRRGVCTRVYTSTHPSPRRLARVRFANSTEQTVDVAGDLREQAIVLVRDGRVEESNPALLETK